MVGRAEGRSALKCNKQMAQMTAARARRQRKAPGSYIVDRNPEDNMRKKATREFEVEAGCLGYVMRLDLGSWDERR